jgi:hypothetical protein
MKISGVKRVKPLAFGLGPGSGVGNMAVLLGGQHPWLGSVVKS